MLTAQSCQDRGSPQRFASRIDRFYSKRRDVPRVYSIAYRRRREKTGFPGLRRYVYIRIYNKILESRDDDDTKTGRHIYYKHISIYIYTHSKLLATERGGE